MKKNNDEEKRKQQMKLLQHKQVRAVPSGYYTGLINDMHEDYRSYQEKNTLQSAFSTLHSPSTLIDHSNDEFIHLDQRKLFDSLKIPLILSSSSIQFTLPSQTRQLQDLSALDFLIRYSHTSNHRQQIIFKLIRKYSHDSSSLIIDDIKEILLEYFNGSQTKQQIDEYFHFLDFHSLPSDPLKKILPPLCVYAERYFLSQSTNKHSIIIINDQRSIQERIDFEFLKRKLDGITLTDSLQRLLHTLQY